MSGQTYTRYLLSCDGCGVELDGESADRARQFAKNLGWGFPHKVKRNGLPSAATSDVCPQCLPGWEDEPVRLAPQIQCSCGRLVTPQGALGHIRMSKYGNHVFDSDHVREMLSRFGEYAEANIDWWIRSLRSEEEATKNP